MENYSAVLLDNIKSIVIAYDYNLEGVPDNLNFINAFGLARLGYTANEVENITIKELLPDNTAEVLLEAIKNFNEVKDFECVLLSKDGIFIDVEASNVLLDKKNKNALLIANDITELKKAEEEMQFLNDEVINQKENFQALIDNLTQTQEQLVQSEKMAALGQLIAGIAHEVNTPLGAIKASVGNINDSLVNVLNSLPVITEEFSKDEQKLFSKLMKESEIGNSQLSSRDKRALRKELAAFFIELGFENTTTLAERCIYLNLQDKLVPMKQEIERVNFEKVINEVRHYMSLVKNARTVDIAVEKASKVVFALKKFVYHDHSGEMSYNDIADGIETVLTLYHNQIKQGIEVVRDFQELPAVMCYPDEINQVWTNLVHNSLQAMGQKGTLTVTTSCTNNIVKVEIADTGTGIDPEIQHRIFDPFFTTKKSGEGSGLGLDIVKKILDKHSGNISFESELGKGTVFRVELPVNQPE